MSRTPFKIWQWVGWCAALFVIYVLFIVKLDPQELGVGGVLAATAATAAWVSQRTGKFRFRIHLRWLGIATRLPTRVCADCAILVAALFKRLTGGRQTRGEFREVPFSPGGNGPVSNARRALVVAGVSFAPNTYVVAVDRERNVLVVHQLIPSQQPPGHGDREWPL